MFDFSIEFAMEAFIIVLLGVAISMFVAFITNIDAVSGNSSNF